MATDPSWNNTNFNSTENSPPHNRINDSNSNSNNMYNSNAESGNNNNNYNGLSQMFNHSANQSHHTASIQQQRQQRLQAFNNRKGFKNRLKKNHQSNSNHHNSNSNNNTNRNHNRHSKNHSNRNSNRSHHNNNRNHKNASNSSYAPRQRGSTNNTNNRRNNRIATNNQITDMEESHIYHSLFKAISIHNKLSDDELISVFQNALYKLNAAWFRQHLSVFFRGNQQYRIQGDIVSFILRLFVFDYEIDQTRHHVPIRYLLLDLIAPHLNVTQSFHKNAHLLKPKPIITEYHRKQALEIFTLWVLELTQNTFAYHTRYNIAHQQAQSSHSNNNSNISLEMLRKYKYNTLQFLYAKEMHGLFQAFKLNKLISIPLKNRICDKIYELLLVHNDAATAVEWAIYFDLFYYIPYNLLLTPLLKESSLLHCAINYVDSLPKTASHADIDCAGYKQEVKKFILSTLSAFCETNQTNVTGARAMKLLQLWKFDINEFEPLRLSQIKSFLKWTIYKGHIDDFAVLTCEHSDALKRFVIQQCQQHSSTYESCLKWAAYWKMENDEQCQKAVQYIKAKQNIFDQQAEAKQTNTHNDNDNNNHHCNDANNNPVENNNDKNGPVFITGFDDLDFCEIKEEQIVFVDTKEKLEMARKVLMDESVDCIGLDLEMMSAQLPIPNAPLQCQILQIATNDTAFLFDLQAVADELDAFDDLLTDVFSESMAVKVGMAWHGDLKHLRKQYPECIAFKSVCTPYLELATISSHMRNDEEFQELTLKLHGTEFVNEDREKKIKNRFKRLKDKEGGLAKIVRWTLDQRLDKFEQLSNWSNRPLRSEQLRYAALDAQVQCWLWRKYKQWEKQGILPDLEGFYEDLYGQ